MGQQQLLLIVLGVIIVGIAIVVGINLFNANSVSANRDGITSDLNNLAAIAHQYYIKPSAMGGGGQDFTNFTMNNEAKQLESNANGTYAASNQSKTTMTFIGTGTQIGNNGTSAVQLGITVNVPPKPDSLYVLN
jgi:hypothetical protein